MITDLNNHIPKHDTTSGWGEVQYARKNQKNRMAVRFYFFNPLVLEEIGKEIEEVMLDC